MRLKVKNDPHFEKDLNSKAVLNVDKDSLFAYKKQREKLKEIFDSQKEIEVLKRDMDEIKAMLRQLINNK